MPAARPPDDLGLAHTITTGVTPEAGARAVQAAPPGWAATGTVNLGDAQQ
jgi:hypothetical protein